MPLFRFHRGSLEESLSTTIIVKTFNDIVRAVVNSELANGQDWGASFYIEPYPDEENNFDPRIGWFTHVFLSNIYDKDKMVPVGFLSEPL